MGEAEMQIHGAVFLVLDVYAAIRKQSSNDYLKLIVKKDANLDKYRLDSAAIPKRKRD
jgi:hypothetical protein